MAHTPGPWEVVMPGEVDEHYAVMDGFGHTASVYGYPENAAEAWANAQLMATAPELLDRLKAMVSGAECECDTADEEHPLCDICWSRQAIAKAEGGTE